MNKHFTQWMQENKYPTGTVYGYVPVEVIEKLIETRGGVVGVRE